MAAIMSRPQCVKRTYLKTSQKCGRMGIVPVRVILGPNQRVTQVNNNCYLGHGWPDPQIIHAAEVDFTLFAGFNLM